MENMREEEAAYDATTEDVEPLNKILQEEKRDLILHSVCRISCITSIIVVTTVLIYIPYFSQSRHRRKHKIKKSA